MASPVASFLQKKKKKKRRKRHSAQPFLSVHVQHTTYIALYSPGYGIIYVHFHKNMIWYMIHYGDTSIYLLPLIHGRVTGPTGPGRKLSDTLASPKGS